MRFAHQPMMARSKSRLKWIADDADLPQGWLRHDGGECPVPNCSRPAVMHRMGSRSQMGKTNAIDLRWKHGDRQEPMDIVAYRPEPDDFVRIERMDLGAKVPPPGNK
jgi:hypothetical protein